MGRWFVASQYSDPSRNARAQLVHAAALVSLASFLVVAGTAAQAERLNPRSALALVMSFGMSIVWVLSRNGHDEIAARLLVGFCVAFLPTFELLPPAGAHGTATMLLPAVLIVSGVLFRQNRARWMSALIFVGGVFPAVLEAAGVLNPGMVPRPSWEGPIYLALALGISAVVVQYVTTVLRDREERYERLVSASFEGIARIVDGRIVQCNPQWEAMLGCTLEHIAKGELSLERLVHPNDVDRFREHERDRNEHPIEIRLRHRDESWRHVELRARYEPSEHGAVLTAIVQDVTEQRKLELAQREAERRFRALLEMGGDLAGLLTPEGRVVVANSAALRLVSATADEVLGQYFWECPWWMHDAAQKERLREAVSRAAAGDSVRFEATHQGADGQLHDVDLSIRPIRDDEGLVSLLMSEGHDVTEQRLAAGRLAASEQRYRALVAASNDAVWLSEADTIVDCNARALRIFGATDGSELIGRSVGSLSPEVQPDGRDSVAAARERVQAALAGTGQTFEWRGRGLDGSPFDVEVSLAVVTLGGTTHVQWVARDIGDRKAAEAAMRESEERFRALIERAPVGVVLGRRRTAEYANPKACQMFGLRHGASGALAIPVASLVAPRDRREAMARLADRELGKHPPDDYYVTLLRSDGTEFPAHVVTRSAVLSDGLAITWFVTDLTERYQARATAARLAAIVGQSAGEIILTDGDGRIEYVNPAFVRANGIESSEFTGKPLRILFERAEPGTTCAEIERQLGRGATWEGRVQKKRRDGTALTHFVIASPIRDSGGEICGHFVLQRDITGDIKMQEAVANADRMHAIGTLAGGIAHDFNNVLGAIIGYCEMARRDLLEGSTPWQDIGLALQAARRASDLVSQMLAFARQPTMPAERMCPRPVVKEALKFLRAALPAGVEMREEIRSDSFVTSNPDEIQRVVMNLCTNAALAMHSGGGVLEVRLEDAQLDEGDARALSLAPGSYLCLTVRDTGCGIAPEVQAHMFEPFFTTRPDGTGTGMGLAVVHGVVTNRGGAVTVDSRLGEGSAFRVFLPIVHGDSAKRDVPTPPAFGHEHILFVDDEPMLTDVASRALSRLGYHVRTFSSPLQALEALRASPNEFDLIVSDMNMPVMNGRSLILRAREIRPELPAILYTGFGDPAEGSSLDDDGIDAFLKKPIRMAELSVVLRSVFQKRREQRAEKG